MVHDLKDFLKAKGIWQVLKTSSLFLWTLMRNCIYSLGICRTSYAKDYFIKSHYSTDDSREKVIKDAQAEFIIRAIGPKKILVAGCAAGELVRALRKKGAEAWGFDISKDMKEIAYPEVKDYLKIGSFTGIPFGAEDHFSALIIIDVLEHIPLLDIGKVIEETGRLASEYLFTIIAHESIFPGHITLLPLSWWRNRFKKYYHLVDMNVDTSGIPRVYGLDDPFNPIRIWKRNDIR